MEMGGVNDPRRTKSPLNTSHRCSPASRPNEVVTVTIDKAAADEGSRSMNKQDITVNDLQASIAPTMPTDPSTGSAIKHREGAWEST